MTRSRAFLVVALPIAVLMTARRSRAGTGAAAAGHRSADGEPIGDRSRGARQVREPLRRLLPVRVRRLDARSTRFPPTSAAYGRFDELQDRNNEILKDILENAAKPRAPVSSCRRSATTTRAAWTKAASRRRAPRRSRPISRAWTRSADKADIPAVVGHLQTVGTSAFFGFGAAPDFKDATQYMLIFGQGGLGLPDRDYYLKDDRELGEAARPVRAARQRRCCSSPATRRPQAADGGEVGHEDRDGAREERARPRRRSATRRTSTTRCRATR